MDGAQTAAASAAATSAAQPQIDDWSALLLHHQARVRALMPKAEKAAADAKAARDEVNAAIEIGATNLGVTNEKFKEWLAKGKTDIVEIGKERQLDEKALKAMGKLVQATLDFGKGQPDTADLQALWHYRGYDDGVNGRDQRDNIDPIYLQDYMQGRTAGMAVLGLGMARGKVLAEDLSKPRTEAPVNLNEPDDDEDDEEKIQAAADKLRKNPEFMARGGGEDDPDGEGEETKAEAPAAGGKTKAQVH